jgi:hypothetical protein
LRPGGGTGKTGADLFCFGDVMNPRVRNPAAVRLLIGWAVIAVVTLAALAALGIRPDGHPTLVRVFGFAVVALVSQGVAAVMSLRSGRPRLAWIVLLAPQLLMAGLAVVLVLLMALT